VRRAAAFIVVFGLAGSLAAAAFDDLQLGVRPQGMGGAFVAVADDANALAWNPAGTVQLARQEATFMHGVYGGVDGLSLDYLGYVFPMRYSALGLAWSNLGATLEEGQNAQTSGYGESTLTLNYSLDPAIFSPDQLLLGVNVKRLSLDSSVGSGAGLGLDFGLLFKPFRYLQAGVELRNVAADVKDETLPSTLRAGLASRLLGGQLTLAADLETVNGINDNAGASLVQHYGLEWRPLSFVALRGGLDDGHPAAGAGLSYHGLSLDYAFLGSDLTGSQHRVGLTVDFGGPSAGPAAAATAATANLDAPKPPVNLKGGYVGGRVVLFWDPSPSREVTGYNFYVKDDAGAWVKANQDLVPADRLGASLVAAPGAHFDIAVTALNLAGQESERSKPLSINAR
jgi:hypothetical protein